MTIVYSINYRDVTRLHQAMSKVPDVSEEVVNRYLHSQGGPLVSAAILGFTPHSGRDKSNYKNNKRHARDSQPYDQDNLNLGFRIYAKGGAANSRNSFGYLVFPNEGRGPHNPRAQQFFERGLESQEDRLMNEQLEALSKAIENIIK